ncbi:hypothetical protein [Adhaeribacter pallidiroseus]|uniref:Uncharacterized protein n=1 Tax=Adhaeribacter pallidiroseus TaxID=2072847 RepID=A0A369QFG5_9BACT|nr:hypothetical protein [Adhaeribacter pallidiroseus]RDC61966.1 hypothetical protein AHMF7616_00556 [Adhaeribacter pallidiroseus]
MKLIIIAFILFYPLYQYNNFKISGDYTVILDKKNRNKISQNYIITFRGSTYTKEVNNGKKINGKIVRVTQVDKNSPVTYLIDAKDYPSKNYLDSSFNKSFGDVVIEFKESEKDTLNFRLTYYSNLHITINTGKLIKVK